MVVIPGSCSTVKITIYRLRQVVGLIYAILYIFIFFMYVLILKDDQSAMIQLKFTVTVMVWFILSFAVKIAMLTDRSIEMLNLVAFLAFMSIGFTYNPQPDHYTSIENFSYYLYVIGGSACDLIDFMYEAAAGPQKETRGPNIQA